MDFVAVQNFHTVGRVMSSMDLRAVEAARGIGGGENERMLLRYFAGEANRYLFEQWEWTELLLGLALVLVLLFGRTYQKFAMVVAILMICVVAAQRFKLTPIITELGRQLEFGSADSRRFAVFHALYGFVELGKLALGLALAGSLVIRTRADRKAFVREYRRVGEA